MSHIWLRHEYKSNERRAPILPQQVGVLVSSGHKVTVERSKCRVFSDNEYENYGAQIAEPGSWHNAPQNTFILGIKEKLQDQIFADNAALQHRHIYFAHVFKGQKSAPETMCRFTTGKGTLLDLEYLVDENGNRVAAFSYSAGFAGAIAAAYIWAEKALGGTPPFTLPTHHLSRIEFVDKIKSKLKAIGRIPRPLIIGARGRSGQGAVDLFSALGIIPVKWGKSDTQSGGPFAEILEYDILCNCVFLAQRVPPFLTERLVVEHSASPLSVVADISNELSFNPIFGITTSTTFHDATLRIGNVDVIEIENLPALTPLDSSVEYAMQLFPHLMELLQEKAQANSIWERAAITYFAHHDIPQLAIESGHELAEMFLSSQQTFGATDIHDYVAEIFAKNPLSATERLYFVDYLMSGATAVLSQTEQDFFAVHVAQANLDELYDSSRMRRHHALLKTVYAYCRSVDFEHVKSADAKNEFFEMCDCLAGVIDQRKGVKKQFADAERTFRQKLGQDVDNAALKKFLADTELLAASSIQGDGVADT